MDLTKLTPEPWKTAPALHDYAEPGETFVVFGGPDDLSTDSTMMDSTHAEFIALARNAFDVMMRRGWSPRPFGDFTKWYLAEEELDEHVQSGKLVTCQNDPFTCLIEADKWYKENVEKQG